VHPVSGYQGLGRLLGMELAAAYVQRVLETAALVSDEELILLATLVNVLVRGTAENSASELYLLRHFSIPFHPLFAGQTGLLEPDPYSAAANHQSEPGV
jgi:hypothetical protein